MPTRHEPLIRRALAALACVLVGAVALPLCWPIEARAGEVSGGRSPDPAASLNVPTGKPSAEAPRALFRVVAFGSSSTEGVGASKPDLAYPAQLERLLNERNVRGSAVSVINRGIGGEDIDDMLRRLRSDILDRKPDLVIWQVGSNDPLRDVPLDRFSAELKAGIASLRAAGIEVMLMEPQWCPAITAADRQGSFTRAVREIGLSEKVAVIRRRDLMHDWVDQGLVTRATLVGPDGLHMTDRGYGLLARAVSDEIEGSVAYRSHRQRALLAAAGAGRT